MKVICALALVIFIVVYIAAQRDSKLTKSINKLNSPKSPSSSD